MSDPIAAQAELLDAARKGQDSAPSQWWGTVETVNPDGTLTVSGMGADRPVAWVLSGYAARTVGDRVLVAMTAAGPCVVGAVGAAPATPQLAGVTVANADPPAGWLVIVAGAVWAKTDPTRLWVKSAAAPAAPAVSTSLTGEATWMGTYRGGSLLGVPYAEQGQYAGASSGNQTGVFVLPVGAFAPLAGKTPTRVVASVRRRAVQHGNSYGLVPLTVWTHSGVAGQPSTPSLSGGSVIGQARLGETATGDLPLTTASGLISGTTTGLAVYDAAPINNAECDQCSVTIYYT